MRRVRSSREIFDSDPDRDLVHFSGNVSHERFALNEPDCSSGDVGYVWDETSNGIVGYERDSTSGQIRSNEGLSLGRDAIGGLVSSGESASRGWDAIGGLARSS
jgi:hypothetical protein